MRYYIWGAGRRAKKFIDNYDIDFDGVIGFVDNDTTKQEYLGRKVLHPEEWQSKKEDYDYIFISIYEFFDIYRQCLNMGIPVDKIAICRCFYSGPFVANYENVSHISTMIYEEAKKTAYGFVALNESDSVDDKRLVGIKPFDGTDYSSDYFRYRTFELAAGDLKGIEGSVAEVGVFKGVFSSLINSAFPDRKLYLFDTFEGFDVKEAEKEIKLGRADDSFVSYHTNGSEEETLKRLRFPDKAVVRKGLFPDSIREEDYSEKFAFVSLDVDFEESTFQGLVFFYPRMSKGGLIFVHDYNTYHLSGIREAIRRYEEMIGEQLSRIPLADRGGTLVIIK